MKICPICRSTFPTKAALASHMPSHQGNRRRERRTRGGGGTTMKLALKEYWGPVPKNKVSTIDCRPADSGLTKLKAHSAMFETYKLVAYTVHVIRGGSSSASGIYFLGVSYKPDKHPVDSQGVASLAPMVCKNAQENATISVPCAKMMGQPWLGSSGASPGAVIISNDTNTDLHVWVTYTVIFNGPTAVQQTSGFDCTYTTDGKTWYDDKKQPITGIDFKDAYAELEIATEEQNAETIWGRFQRAFTTARELHRSWIQSIGLVHMVLGAARVAAPALGVPAILHLQPRPFRATAAQWRLLGVTTGASTSASTTGVGGRRESSSSSSSHRTPTTTQRSAT